MADRNFPSARTMCFDYRPVLIAGSFSATGAGITAGTIYGNGFNVVYTGAGLYTITTTDPYRHVIDFGSHLGLTAPNIDRKTNCGIPTVGAGNIVTMTVNVFPTAPPNVRVNPAAAGDRISFWMLLSNSATDFVR